MKYIVESDSGCVEIDCSGFTVTEYGCLRMILRLSGGGEYCAAFAPNAWNRVYRKGLEGIEKGEK